MGYSYKAGTKYVIMNSKRAARNLSKYLLYALKHSMEVGGGNPLSACSSPKVKMIKLLSLMKVNNKSINTKELLCSAILSSSWLTLIYFS